MSLSSLSSKIRSAKIRCSVVIVAAGASQRFGGDKILSTLMGTPILAYSIKAFEVCDYVSEIIIVTSEDKIMPVAKLCDEFGFAKVTKVLLGGATRLESALVGASEVDVKSNLIAVHDGARPLVTAQVIEDAIVCASINRAAVPAIGSCDTVKIVDNKLVQVTPPREMAFCVQTPQVFLPEILKGALTNALEKNIKVYDDASAVEALGFSVYITPGAKENIKITEPLDLAFAEVILQQRRLEAETKAVSL